MKRKINLSEIEKEEYDIVIIGGGITGAGILWIASKYNYKCLLIEKGDFASGTSSRSAKLIHGGLRYLQYGQFGLVKEAIEERNYLLRHFPYLVKPLEFIFPVYSSKWKYHIGMFIYQLFNKGKYTPNYSFLNIEQTKQIIPAITIDKLKGSFSYYDAVTNDARLCNEIIMIATEQENVKALNYCEFILLEKNKENIALQCYDHIENKTIKIKSKYIINATGAWADDILDILNKKSNTKTSTPAKGVHIVLSANKFPIKQAILFPSYANDKRMLYAIPWENNSVIVGSTDTSFKGNINNPTIGKNDVTYILNALSHFVPSLKINENDIISQFVGIRPLINDGKSTKDSSRDYRIWWENEYLLNIIGGKLTSFRSMALSLLKELLNKYPKDIRKVIKKREDNHLFKDIAPEVINTLQDKYGESFWDIINIILEDRNNISPIHPTINILIAEVKYFIRFQQCYYLDDILTRRFSLRYVLTQYSDYELLIKKIALIMKSECGWTQEEYLNEYQSFIKLINNDTRAENQLA